MSESGPHALPESESDSDSRLRLRFRVKVKEERPDLKWRNFQVLVLVDGRPG